MWLVGNLLGPPRTPFPIKRKIPETVSIFAFDLAKFRTNLRQPFCICFIVLEEAIPLNGM